MIRISNCVKIYNQNKNNEVVALRGVKMDVAKGEAIAIMGISGSGKSTLLNIIGCLDVMTSGEYILDGCDVSNMNASRLAEVRSGKIGFVLQSNALMNNESVYENVKLPLIFGDKYKMREFKARIMEVLRHVGIDKLAKKKVRELSGGQIQRVAIARALVNDPEIILADEPTSALDSKTADEIMSLFNKLNEQGKTIIVVTHDIHVANLMQRTVKIVDGEIAAQDI